VNDAGTRPHTPGATAGGALLALAPLLPHVDRSLLASSVESLRLELWLTDATLGLVASVFAFLLALAGPAFLALGDRGPRPRIVAAGLLLAALGALLAGLARNFPALLAARGAAGIGLAAGASLAPALLARPGGGWTLLVGAGAAAGYVLGAVALATVGWRGAFFTAAGVGVLAAVAWLRTPEPDPGRPQGAFVPFAPDRVALVARRLASRRDWTLTVTGFAALAFAAAALAFWAPPFLARVRSVPAHMAAGQLAATVLMAGIAGTLVGPLVAGRLRARFREADRLVAGCAAILAAPLLVAAFVSPKPHEYLPALVGGLALLFASARPAAAALLDGVDPADAASAAALSFLAARLAGEAPAPVLVGALADAGSLARAVLAVPAAALFAGGLWLWVAWRNGRAARR
jgi:predicted MFS family arabinose efflux permease